MNNDTKKQIVDALNNYMERHDISQNDIAKNSGVNASYIIAMRSGSYTLKSKDGKEVAIADKWYNKIAEFVGFSLKKNYWETRPTEQLVEMMAILQDAKKFSYTNVVIGDTGCGKSYAIELFKEAHPRDVFVVTVSQLDNIGDLLDKTIDILKIAVEKPTKSKKLKLIADKLHEMKLDNRTPVIIFDECEYMKQPALCAIKELYDNLNKHCAIVLVGHHQLISNIERLRRKSKDGIPQFYRRIKFGIRYLPSIDRSFSDFTSNMDKGLCKLLSGMCENYGELHDVMVPVLREADRTGAAITEDFVKTVLNIR